MTSVRPRRRTRGLARVAAGLALLVGGAAQAADPAVYGPEDRPPGGGTLAVLILSGEEAGVPLSEVYATVRAELELHTRFDVLPLESITGADRASAIRECKGDPACLARRFRLVLEPLDRLLTISLQPIGDTLVLAMRLIDTRNGVVMGAVAEEVPVGMSAFVALRERLGPVFDEAGWGTVAEVFITSEPGQAQVRAAGRTCVTPCRLKRMPPGDYVLRISKPGHEERLRSVALVAGESLSVRVTLDRKKRSVFASPWLWAAVGVVATAGVSTAVVLSQEDGFTFRLEDAD